MQMRGDIQGIVFDIQHFSLHDGPGVRSTIFLKGCPLSCWWCGNPESQSHKPQLLFFRHLCTGCGECAVQCPRQAMRPDEQGFVMRHEHCSACGQCVPFCRQGARALSGKVLSVKEVCDTVRRHWRIFQTSGGGVTISGGEALSQMEFLAGLVETLHEDLGLHTCLDSCGHAPWTALERMLPFLDMALLDIKHMDGNEHERGTGIDNRMILENARHLARSRIPVVVRLPLIPGFNDDSGNIAALGAFLQEIGLRDVEIMPYHTLGLTKYAALGRQYAFAPEARPKVEESVSDLQRYGLKVSVHGH
jgi:pyruvate formate lyase activating enzyme